MYKIKDILTPRKDVLEGIFQGVIQTHKVDAEEKRLENNPEEFLKITYPSTAIKRTLELIKEKLTGKSNQGGFLLVGPYGSGKSHTLITLYHLFNNPPLARDWGQKWKINFELPRKSRSVIISTRRYDVDHLWEPIFKLLKKEDLLKEIKRFPTTDQIEELIGDDIVAIFIDEIENWYGAFDAEKQAHIIEQNETFLEHLLEVAADPAKNLFVFITFLEEKEGLKKIFNRTKPVRIDVSPIEDREKVVLHRLFEEVESIDQDKVESVIDRYISAYSDSPIKLENIQNYKQRMIRTYPFHPFLLETLFQIYESAAERQDIRGMLNVLADAVKNNYERKDLILVSDIDENDFRGIDLKLMEKYEFDLERVKDIGFAREILKTILILTLNEKTNGATESDILLSVFSPSEGRTLNTILTDLKDIYGKPHYLHKENGIYLFKHELNIYALLEKEKSKLSEEEIKKKIAEIVKKDIFEGAFIFGFDEIPDHNKLKVVIVPESWGTKDELKTKLNEFYRGKTWQNSYILVLPTANIFSYEILEKAKRLKSAENLMNQVGDEEGKLSKIIQEERKNIADKIKTFYGYIVKWVEYEGELNYRLVNVSADINDIREKAKSDQGLVADFIVKSAEAKSDGIRIEDLINDFKKYRKYPFILDDETIYTSIRNLHKDKRVLIQGERGKWYIDESPRTLEPSFVIFHPKYVPEIEKPEIYEKGPEVEVRSETPKVVSETEIAVERKEKKELSLTGNSPRVILSQIEARTSEEDEFEEISIKYIFKQKLSKQEIMKFIKQLPNQEECEIQAEITFWRKKE